MRQRSGWLVGVRPYLLLAGLCLALYLPGISAIPPLDRDEARFAQATRQMLETGDYLRIRFQDEARNKKPAGIYWLQALSVDALSNPSSTAMWPYRLPSLLGGMLAVLLTFGFGAAMFGRDGDPLAGRRIGFAAAVFLAASLGLVTEAHIAKTDAMLLFAVTLGQGALGLAYVRQRSGRPVPLWIPIAFWAAEIAAVLLKGPPGPALAALTAATLSIADGEARWLRSLRPVAGIVVLIAAVAPWVTAIEQASGGRFLADALGQDLVLKLVGAQESHGAPPFAYLLLSVATFWPGSLLIVPALIRGWQRHDMPAERFALAWLVPAWVVLELVPTKLPHYVLPLYPALALLVAAALVDDGRSRLAGWARWVDRAVTVLWLAVAVALGVLLIGSPLRFADHLAAAGVIGAILLIGLAGVLVYWRPAPARTVVLAAALAMAFAIPAGSAVLPALDRLWLSRAAAALVAQYPARAGLPLVAVGYSEPSIIFLLGTDLRLLTPRGAAEVLTGGGEALVSGREDAMFRQALSARGLVAQPLGKIRGLDYSNGQRMELTLYDVSRG